LKKLGNGGTGDLPFGLKPVYPRIDEVGFKSEKGPDGELNMVTAYPENPNSMLALKNVLVLNS